MRNLGKLTQRIEQTTEAMFPDMVKFLADLVRLRTYTGEEGPAAERTLVELRAIGCDKVWMDFAATPAEVAVWKFSTDGTYAAGAAGIPTLGFGPQEEQYVHTMGGRLQDANRAGDSLGRGRKHQPVLRSSGVSPATNARQISTCKLKEKE